MVTATLWTGSISFAQTATPTPVAVAPAPDAMPAAPVASILPAIKISQNLTDADKKAIAAFVGAEASALAAKGASAEAQSQARDALITGMRVDGSAAKSSPDFLYEYVEALNKVLLPLVHAPSMRVRLNVAIVTAHAAADAPNRSGSLEPTIAALLKDENDPPVLIWALKAAQPLMPQSLTNPMVAFPSPNPIANAVLVKAKQHSTGPVVEEAYQALTLGWLAKTKQLTPAMYATVIPIVQALLQSRIDTYKTSVPEDPVLDANYGLRFLTDTNILPLETPAQKLQTAQLLNDLTSLAAFRAGAAAKGSKEELILLLSRASGYLQLLARNEGAEPGSVPVQTMGDLSKLVVSSSPAKIQEAARAALVEFRRIPAFSTVVAAPEPLATSAATTSTSP